MSEEVSTDINRKYDEKKLKAKTRLFNKLLKNVSKNRQGFFLLGVDFETKKESGAIEWEFITSLSQIQSGFMACKLEKIVEQLKSHANRESAYSLNPISALLDSLLGQTGQTKHKKQNKKEK